MIGHSYRNRPDRKFLSRVFVAKLSGIKKTLEWELKYKIPRRSYDNWTSGVNRAPVNHEGLLKLGQEFGLTEGEMFE